MTGDPPPTLCVPRLSGRGACIALCDGPRAAQLRGTKAPLPPFPKPPPTGEPMSQAPKGCVCGGGGVVILRRIWSEAVVSRLGAVIPTALCH